LPRIDSLVATEPAQISEAVGRDLEARRAGFRSWRVGGLPMQWLYFETEDYLDVVRLLATRQDIAAILSNGD
jgi:hypothetical protein